MPGLGFGTWQLADGKETVGSVSEALRAGYRLIDTAKIYGNEKSVGEAVRASKISREEIFVTTKLWNSDQGYDSAIAAFGEGLNKLGLEYVDLYLIHWPGHNASRRLDSWRALVQIYEKKKAKSIGVSNFMVNHLEELLTKGSIVPAINQIEFHPFIYDKQLPILEFCKARGIVVEAYSPLDHGHNMNDTTLRSIASQHNKSVAQVMLRWAIQHGTVPIPKSSHLQRIRENLDIFDFKLSSEEIKAIDELGGRGKSGLPFYVKLLK